MASDDQAGPGRRGIRGRADTVGLAAAGLLWLLVQGYCAIHILREPTGGGTQAVLVMAAPFLVLVGWWALLRRASVRLRSPAGSASAGLGFSNGLLVLATALGVGAAWFGQTHVRAAREAARLAAARLADPQTGDAAVQAVQMVQSYHTLALAGGLLQLAVVTLGVALCRHGRPDPNRSATASAQ